MGKKRSFCHRTYLQWWDIATPTAKCVERWSYFITNLQDLRQTVFHNMVTGVGNIEKVMKLRVKIAAKLLPQAERRLDHDSFKTDYYFTKDMERAHFKGGKSLSCRNSSLHSASVPPSPGYFMTHGLPNTLNNLILLDEHQTV